MLGFKEINIVQISLAQKFQNLWPRESSCLGSFWPVHPGTFYAYRPPRLLLPEIPLSCFAWASTRTAHFLSKSPAWAWQLCPNLYQPPNPTHIANKMSHWGHANKLELPVPSPEKRTMRSHLSDGKLRVLISKRRYSLSWFPEKFFSLLPAQKNGVPFEMFCVP